MDYLTAALQEVKEGKGNFNPLENRNLSVYLSNKDIEKVEKPIQITNPELPDIIMPGVRDNNTIGINIIEESQLNKLIPYDSFQEIVISINKSLVRERGNNWGSQNKEFCFLNTELLGVAYNISTLLINGRRSADINWIDIKIEMIKMFRLLVGLNIRTSAEVSLYSLLTANQAMFQKNPSTKIENFNDNFWEGFLIPLVLKQEQLIGVKFIEFWMYLGFDFNNLLKDTVNYLLEEA